MPAALVYGYSCFANDIKVPRCVRYNGCSIDCRGMSPQEYVEYTDWFDYCNFSDEISQDSFMVIGTYITGDGIGTSLENLQDGMKNVNDILRAVYDLTGKDIEKEDCSFYAIEKDW